MRIDFDSRFKIYKFEMIKIVGLGKFNANLMQNQRSNTQTNYCYSKITKNSVNLNQIQTQHDPASQSAKNRVLNDDVIYGSFDRNSSNMRFN